MTAHSQPKPHVSHRGGLFRKVARLRPDPTMFRRVGGREIVGRIVDGLYDRIHDDPLLQPMFRRDPQLERSNQKMFFEEWLGGEPLYSRHVASAGLRVRHGHARIAPRDAAQWLAFFRQAMQDAGVAAPLQNELLAILRPLATAFVNDEDPTGPPDPDRHRCGKDHELAAATKAAAKGVVDAVRAAITAMPRLVTAAPWGKPSLLYVAASRGRVHVIRLLVAAGADPNQPSHVDWGAGLETPLCGALRKKKAAAAALLRELGARDDILTAATVGNQVAVAEYLAADPTLVDVTDPADDLSGGTPLLHAVSAGQREVALLLLRRGASVGARSPELVRAAADDADLELLSALFERGADARCIGPGRWVLDAELSRVLCEHGADVTYEADPWGSWIWRSCTGNHAQKDDPDWVRALLAHGADPNAIHPYWRRNALHFAAKAGFVGTVTALLEAGASVDLPDAKDAETALFHAFKAGRSVDPRPVALALLAAGADPAAKNRRGRTVFEVHPKSRAILAEFGAG